jgi:hypothetical protein
MEMHWRVQSSEIYYPVLKMDFIGKVENLMSDLQKLSTFLFQEQCFDLKDLKEINASPMSTGASNLMHEYYTDQLQEIVYERFNEVRDLIMPVTSVMNKCLYNLFEFSELLFRLMRFRNPRPINVVRDFWLTLVRACKVAVAKPEIVQ